MSIVPKATRKLAIRLVIGLFSLAVIFAVYNWMRANRDLGDISVAATADWLLALEHKEEGQQAVIFKPDGSILRSPGYADGKTDRDAVWRPDGAAVFMSSDRETEDFNVYRWNLQHNIIERRGMATRSQLGLNFGEPSLGATNDSLLIVSGGFVLSMNPKEATTRQVLPPVGREVVTTGGDEGAGGASQFDAYYKRLGSSFREAKWGKNKEWVYAVLRGDEGETLIAQSMTNGKPPAVLGMGERIEFDVNPKTGSVVYAIQGFRVPVPENPSKEELAKIKEMMAITHRLAEVKPWETDPAEAFLPLAMSPTNNTCFAHPKVCPDGNSVLVSVGKYLGDGNQQMEGLLSLPLARNGIAAASALVKGEVTDYSWNPTGKKFAFIRKSKSGVRTVFVLDKTGGEAKQISDGKTSYSRPLFSPQVP